MLVWLQALTPCLPLPTQIPGSGCYRLPCLSCLLLTMRSSRVTRPQMIWSVLDQCYLVHSRASWALPIPSPLPPCRKFKQKPKARCWAEKVMEVLSRPFIGSSAFSGYTCPVWSKSPGSSFITDNLSGSQDRGSIFEVIVLENSIKVDENEIA